MFSTKSTFLFLFAVCQLFAKTVTCAPAPIPNPDTADQINNSYSGSGGHASGGGVTTNSPNPKMLLGGMGLLDLASGKLPLIQIAELALTPNTGNGGGGGKAKSGPAVAGSGPVAIAGPGSTVTDPNGSASSSGSTSHSFGNAYSGAGGTAEGGSVTNNPALVKLFSGMLFALGSSS
jgi:hypothetical protein